MKNCGASFRWKLKTLFDIGKTGKIERLYAGFPVWSYATRLLKMQRTL